jgi:hypothetical protein
MSASFTSSPALLLEEKGVVWVWEKRYYYGLKVTSEKGKFRSP